MPMPYSEIYLALKFKDFIGKTIDRVLVLAQNIDHGCTLKSPRRGGSNEYQQSMFWGKTKKNKFTIY